MLHYGPEVQKEVCAIKLPLDLILEKSMREGDEIRIFVISLIEFHISNVVSNSFDSFLDKFSVTKSRIKSFRSPPVIKCILVRIPPNSE